jgi:hypothetical protein
VVHYFKSHDFSFHFAVTTETWAAVATPVTVVLVLAVLDPPPPQAVSASNPRIDSIIFKYFITDLRETVTMNKKGSTYGKGMIQRTGIRSALLGLVNAV